MASYTFDEESDSERIFKSLHKQTLYMSEEEKEINSLKHQLSFVFIQFLRNEISEEDKKEFFKGASGEEMKDLYKNILRKLINLKDDNGERGSILKAIRVGGPENLKTGHLIIFAFLSKFQFV